MSQQQTDKQHDNRQETAAQAEARQEHPQNQESAQGGDPHQQADQEQQLAANSAKHKNKSLTIEGESRTLGETSEAATVDTRMGAVASIGYAVILVVFVFLLGWAYLAPLDSASHAPGIVTVESYRKTIQHLEGGIVNEILVRDGQLVEKGELLIVLDDTQLKAQLEIAKSQYIAVLALQARLIAERDHLEQIDFDAFIREQQQKNEVEQVMSIQQQVFVTRRAAREGEVSVLKQRIDQLKEQIRGLRELVKSEKKEIHLYREEIEEFKALLKDGYTDKSRMREMQRRVAELEGSVSKNQSAITAANIQIGEAELQILQIEKQFQLEVAEKLSEATTRINDLRERIIAIEDKISRTRITAPESGMVISMSIHTIGGVIAPRSPILEIVPQNEALIVEAKVSPTDIDKVRSGLISEIRFSAFKSATTPIIEGVVVSVSADVLFDKQSGLSYYLARIRVTKDSEEKLKGLTLMPGMPAEVLIKTGERTLFQYLIQPVTDAFARSFNED